MGGQILPGFGFSAFTRFGYQIGGWKGESMYQRYNIVSEADVRAAAQRYQTYVDTLPVKRKEAPSLDH